MKSDFVSFIQLATGSISFLVTIIFTYYNWKKGWFGKLFSIVLFLVSYGIIIGTLAAMGTMAHFPHTFRTGLMVLYLIPALTYIGLRVGFSKKPFRMLDIFHLVPVIFYLVNFAPSIFSSAAVKRNLINPENMRTFKEGIIFAPYAVQWLATVLILFYIAKIYIEFILQPNQHIKPYHQTTTKLLMIFLGIHLLPPLFSISGYYDGQHRVSFVIVHAILTIGFYFVLLNRPKIIYGSLKQISFDNQPKISHFITAETSPLGVGQDQEIHAKGYKQINGPSPAVNSGGQPEKIMTPEWKKIEKYMDESMPFLNTSFSQQDLINATKLSAYQIRTILKASGKPNFSTYINEKRIEYLLKMLKKEKK